jgi:hypothetical protein
MANLPKIALTPKVFTIFEMGKGSKVTRVVETATRESKRKPVFDSKIVKNKSEKILYTMKVLQSMM